MMLDRILALSSCFFCAAVGGGLGVGCSTGTSGEAVVRGGGGGGLGAASVGEGSTGAGGARTGTAEGGCGLSCGFLRSGLRKPELERTGSRVTMVTDSSDEGGAGWTVVTVVVAVLSSPLFSCC